VISPFSPAFTYNLDVNSDFDDLEKQARDPSNESAVDEAWLEEALRRYDAYCRGEMQSVPGDEAMARARNRLR
jgi:hypothetical protein